MKIRFCGGAQNVTGSQFLLSVNGKNILLECGMFQGRRSETYERNLKFMYDPRAVDALVLSHAHVDHSGNIPNLVKHDFTGSIFATPATVDLCKIMLRDSAYIQEKDTEWVNKIRSRNHQPPIEPIYTRSDAEAAMDRFVGVDYGRTFTAAAGVNVTFRDAGHILGSACVLLEISENNRPIRLGFYGDVGRPDVPVLRDPSLFTDIEACIIESTYGNRLHGAHEDIEEELGAIVRATASNGGKLIIPAFAVGRTQHLVYILHKLYNQNRIPDIPIFVDSPMACAATEVFRNHRECFDRETDRIFLRDGEDPFSFPRLTWVEDVEQSKSLNSLKYPHVIIAPSGMAEGGRILHHLRNNIDNHRVQVLFVGFAAKDTLARKIMDGEKNVRIFGEEHKVRCKITTLDAFSAHADRKDLLRYIGFVPPEKLKQIFLVHGEPDQALPLRDALRSKGYPHVHYPAPGETLEV
jgi:metallo-beta-lactamase family protein